MAQKTAMMELIDYMKANFHLTDESLEKFDELLEKEKEQIMLSHCDGFLRTTDLQILNPEQYYNETYKQD